MSQRFLCVVAVFLSMIVIAQEAQAQPLFDLWLNDESSDYSTAGLEMADSKNVVVVIEEFRTRNV